MYTVRSSCICNFILLGLHLNQLLLSWMSLKKYSHHHHHPAYILPVFKLLSRKYQCHIKNNSQVKTVYSSASISKEISWYSGNPELKRKPERKKSKEISGNWQNYPTVSKTSQNLEKRISFLDFLAGITNNKTNYEYPVQWYFVLCGCFTVHFQLLT